MPIALSRSSCLESDPKAALDEVFDEVEQQIIQQSEVDVDLSGSTSVCILMHKNQLLCANVGDSRCILVKQGEVNKWSVIPLSRDHKPQDEEEAQRIVEAGGRIESFKAKDGQYLGPLRVWLKEENSPGLAMTRSIGDLVAQQIGVTHKPEIVEYVYTPQDRIIVLGSDGLWEFISNKEVVQMLVPYYNQDDIEGACDKLMQEADYRWKQESDIIDDITFIVIFIGRG